MEILGLRIFQSNNLNQIPTVIDLDGKDMAKCLKDNSQPQTLAEGEEAFKDIDLDKVRALILKKIQRHLTFNRTLYYDLALEFLTSFGRVAVVSNCNMLYFYTQVPLIDDQEEEGYLMPISHGISLSCEHYLATLGTIEVPDDALPDTFYLHHFKYHFDQAAITFEVNRLKLMSCGYSYIYKAHNISSEELYLLNNLPHELRQIGTLLALDLESDSQLLTNIQTLDSLQLSYKAVADFFCFKNIFKDMYKYYYLDAKKGISADPTAFQILQLNDLITHDALKVKELYGANIMLKAVHNNSSEATRLATKINFDFPQYYKQRELILKLPLKLYHKGVFENCINNSQEYLARRFINEETIIDTALITFIEKEYITTDMRLVDVKAHLLNLAADLKEKSRQPLHDLALYLQALVHFAEKHDHYAKLFDCFIKPQDIEQITSTIKTTTNLLLSAKPKSREALAAALHKTIEEQGGPIHFDDYTAYLRKDTSLGIYSHALEICNEYASLDLKTLKRAASQPKMLQMLHHELHNAFTPQIVRGKDYCRTVLWYYVHQLLQHEGKPTKEQKGLYHQFTQIVPMEFKAYTLLDADAYQKLTDIIAGKNKLMGSVLQALPDFEAELLDANDFRNLITGDATNCCMGAGTKKQIVYTYAEAFNQIIITNCASSKILLDTVIWRNLYGYLVFDNIEAIQVNHVNSEIFKILLFKMAHCILQEEQLVGFIQGTNYNDLELYQTESQAIPQPCIALDKRQQLYHNFYSDAHEVKTDFEDPVTKEQFHYTLPKLIDVTTV